MNNKKYVVGVLFLFTCFGIAYYVCGAQVWFTPNQVRFPSNKDGELTALTMTQAFCHIPTKKSASCVSLALYDEGLLLIARYSSGMHLLNLKTGEMSEIKPENLESCKVLGGDGTSANKKVWNPTGLYFDSHTKMLYVANYTGHNILVGNITDKGTFAVEKMIVAEGLTSPENIAVNETGNRIAVADYDGNSIFLFDKDGIVLWQRDMPLAHGVEISDSSVYGTSLGNREIVQFDYSGNEIRRVGHCANSGINAYMWPTSLEFHKGKLIVTDAHTGRLTVLNEKLEYETALGSNGPYVTNFNYPYAAIVIGNRLYVADTFANRILEMDMEGNLLIQYSQELPRIPSVESPSYVPHYPYSMAYLFEEQKEVPPSFFCEVYGNDMKVVAGLTSFWLTQGDNKIQLPLIDYPSVSFWEAVFVPAYFYNTWSKKVSTQKHEYYILGSPQSSSCIVFSIDTAFCAIVYIETGKTSNIYCLDGEIIGDKERWNEMLRKMDELTDMFIRNNKAGKTRYAAYIDTLVPYYQDVQKVNISPENDMEAWLEFQCSQTDSGKALYKAVKDGTFTAEDYKSYVDDCYREPNKHSIFERLLLRTFTGATNQ